MTDPAPQRLSLQSFLQEVRDELFSLDRGFLHTVRLMVTRPGPTIASYWRGEQPQLTRPLRYFLIVFAIYAAAFVSSGAIDLVASDLDRTIVETINASRSSHGQTPVTLEQVTDTNPLSYYRSAPLAYELLNATILFLATWAAFIGWGLNAAERLTMTLYLYGTWNLVQVPLIALMFTSARQLTTNILPYVFLGYLMWASARVRAPARATQALRGLAWWVGMQLLFIVLIAGLSIRVGWQLAQHDHAASHVAAPAAPATAPAGTPATR